MSVIADYYRDVDIMARMQLDGEPFWERGNVAARYEHAEAIVYLGCNVLRTLSIAREISALVEAIEPGPVVTLGGPSRCCGSTHKGLLDDDRGAAKRGMSTMETWRSLTPRTVVQWCPVCERMYEGYPEADFEAEAFESVHATEYLARNVKRLTFTTDRPLRVALHVHRGDDQAERDARHAVQALEQLEGVTVVDGGDLKGFSYQCFTNAEKPTAAFTSALDRSIGAAVEAGADMVLSVYHSCHRALVRNSGRFSPGTANFVSIIARRAGLAVPDRYQEFVALGDEDAIWRAVSPRFNEDKEQEDVRRVIREYLLVSRAPARALTHVH